MAYERRGVSGVVSDRRGVLCRVEGWGWAEVAGGTERGFESWDRAMPPESDESRTWRIEGGGEDVWRLGSGPGPVRGWFA